MTRTSTLELREDYARAKAECACLTEVLRTFDPTESEPTEAELQAQLIAALLKVKALGTRLEQRSRKDR